MDALTYFPLSSHALLKQDFAVLLIVTGGRQVPADLSMPAIGPKLSHTTRMCVHTLHVRASSHPPARACLETRF